MSFSSRSSAGTVDVMPGEISQQDTHKSNLEFTDFNSGIIDCYSYQDKNLPELLPVSCGYFFNIVRNLLMKQRKFMLRYILLHTNGVIFDSLVKYIKYHSLADLLIELMQLTVVFQPPPSLRKDSFLTDEDNLEDDLSIEEEKKRAGPVLTED